MKRAMTMLLPVLLALISAAHAGVRRIDLAGAWQFKRTTDSEWLPAVVPGQVHEDLLRCGLIDDPFVGTNDKRLQWVGEKDWEYRRTFTVDAAWLAAERVELVLEGVDTYADLYVNDRPVEHFDNMFRTWRVDLRSCLHEGENTLRIVFRSVFREDMPKYLAAPYRLQAWPNNDQNDVIWLSLYARKAGFHYGWDWGPRLITAGIWRGVRLEGWDGVRIDAVQVATRSIGRTARMEARCAVEAVRTCEATVTVACEGRTLATAAVRLRAGENEVALPFEVRDPQLWWCNGLGGQPLYRFDVAVRSGAQCCEKEVVTGIRTVEIVREKDRWGRSMYVRLNGRPVFAKGANFIPLDNFSARIPDARYEHIVRSAAECNMNMLRVWGGGIYERDLFYELCDRYGLLVWQDMMFACGMFPADSRYLASVEAEVRDNVRRLRNHPSIVLWNGNNENEISYYGWGWRDKTPEAWRASYERDLHKLFYETIPRAIAAEDDTRYYHPTSPSTGYSGIGCNMGDVHFWSVWKGGWIEEYTQPGNIGRFMSEYGFQSYPEISTIRKFAAGEERRIGSETMLCHQRARDDNTRDPHYGDRMMIRYMERYFRVPERFDEFVYLSQLLQAEAVKVGIEAHRRAKPRCMGSLFWQIDDCWPVASWSSIDYYGRWKALQYYARRAFAEVLVSPVREDGVVRFEVISDRPAPFRGELSVTTMTLGGEVLLTRRVPVSLAADGSLTALAMPERELLAGRSGEETFVYAELTERGEVCSTNCCYPVYSNRYAYPAAEPRIEATPCDGGLMLTIEADRLVRGLCLQVEDEATCFDDNYLTLVPGHPQRVKVFTALSPEAFRAQLEYLSLNRVN